jgi:hypothetical protein
LAAFVCIATVDPDVVIEEQYEGYVRYRHTDGRRWEVRGICDRRGDCLIGAVIDTSAGPVQIRDHAHLEELKALLGRDRIDSELDVPVGPGFKGCCSLEVTPL